MRSSQIETSSPRPPPGCRSEAWSPLREFETMVDDGCEREWEDPGRIPMGDGGTAGNPLAYFLTFRCYGTWLHGDGRGSVDALHNVPGTPRMAPNGRREEGARGRMRQQAV